MFFVRVLLFYAEEVVYGVFEDFCHLLGDELFLGLGDWVRRLRRRPSVTIIEIIFMNSNLFHFIS